MNRIFLLCLLFLVGCAQVPRMPPDVAAMPDDCANRQAIIRWLDSLVQVPKSTFENAHEYEQTRSKIKARIWSIRYNCQRV
jgi:hypothetical protein